MWLCGHKHFYERSAPAFAGKVDAAGGMVQVVNGAAGNNEGVEKGKGVGHGLIVAANYEDQGYGELATLNTTALRWQYILSKDGSVFDEVVLMKRQR